MYSLLIIPEYNCIATNVDYSKLSVYKILYHESAAFASTWADIAV